MNAAEMQQQQQQHQAKPACNDQATVDQTASPAHTHAEQAADAPPCADQPLPLRIEALLLATDKPLSASKIATLLGIDEHDSGTRPVREAIEALNETYESSGRSFRVEAVAGGMQILTTPTFGPVLHRLHQDRAQSRLSPAALETLAIIAYRQPILRADIESIRGVACGEVLRGLMERRMVKIVGRAEEIGRPILYGTTREFLRVFGLATLEDLPQAKELREPAAPTPRKPSSSNEASADESADVDPSNEDETRQADTPNDSSSIDS